MSWLGNLGKGELFNLKDMWKGLKKNPWRALTGVDPLSTKLTNTVTGRDDDPLIDQMGGPYGGHTISAFGNKDGGVYKRGEEAGVDMGAMGTVNDAAHIIAAYFGGQGLMNVGQNFMGGGGPSNAGSTPGGNMPRMPMSQQQPQQPAQRARPLVPQAGAPQMPVQPAQRPDPIHYRRAMVTAMGTR